MHVPVFACHEPKWPKGGKKKLQQLQLGKALEQALDVPYLKTVAKKEGPSTDYGVPDGYPWPLGRRSLRPSRIVFAGGTMRMKMKCAHLSQLSQLKQCKR